MATRMTCFTSTNARRALTVIALAASVVQAAAQSAPPPGSLQGSEWQLVRFQGGDGKVLTPDDRTKYTISFGREGRLAVRFDCNRGAGTWKSAGPSQIEFGPMAMTRAMCPPGSLHDQLVKQWPFIRSYVMRNGHLFLSLMADGGTFEFEPAGGAGPAAPEPVARYTCGSTDITTHVRGDALDLTIGGKSFTLSLTKSASGARYASTGSPAVTFWSKGQRATLTIGASTYPECVRQ